jgi:hypothetical protein
MAALELTNYKFSLARLTDSKSLRNSPVRTPNKIKSPSLVGRGWENHEKFQSIHEGRLQSSWTHLITPSRNLVEVRWRSLFQSTSFGKRWSLWNFLPRSSLLMVGKAHKSHGESSGLYGECSNGVPPIHIFQAEHRIQFRSRPVRFLGFSNHEKGAPRQISKWSTVCNTFSRSGWSVVRSASLAKGVTTKKRPSPHLHKFPIRSNKVSPRTFQTALVIRD